MKKYIANALPRISPRYNESNIITFISIHKKIKYLNNLVHFYSNYIWSHEKQIDDNQTQNQHGVLHFGPQMYILIHGHHEHGRFGQFIV